MAAKRCLYGLGQIFLIIVAIVLLGLFFLWRPETYLTYHVSCRLLNCLQLGLWLQAVVVAIDSTAVEEGLTVIVSQLGASGCAFFLGELKHTGDEIGFFTGGAMASTAQSILKLFDSVEVEVGSCLKG